MSRRRCVDASWYVLWLACDVNSERVAVSWELTVLRILAFLERTELRTVAFLGRFNGLGNFVQLQSHISNEFGHRKLVFIIACQNVHYTFPWLG